MQATPGAPALVFGDATLSYADLDRRSAALAGLLPADGIVGVRRVRRLCHGPGH